MDAAQSKQTTLHSFTKTLQFRQHFQQERKMLKSCTATERRKTLRLIEGFEKTIACILGMSFTPPGTWMGLEPREMNLKTTIDLRAAKNDSEFQKMMYAAIKHTRNIESGFKIAVEKIEKYTPYKPILTLIPLNEINIIKLLPGDEKAKKVSGRYDPDKDSITMRQAPAFRLMVIELLCHEFGHHLADTYLNPKNHDSHGHIINPKGTNVYVHCELVDELYTGAEDEYNKEKAKLEEKSGVDLDDNVDKEFEKLYNVGTDAPSLYSLRTIDEWFAEFFALAFTASNESDILKKRFRKTWDAVNAVLTGRVLASTK